MRPFVVPSGFTLWGRDVLGQWGTRLDIPSKDQGFRVGVIEGHITIPKLQWTSEEPVRVEQWPLSKEKLSALRSLVKEQLSLGHIVPSDSP